MAINVPIVSEFVDKGIKSAIKEFESLEGPAQKAGFALEKAFVPASVALGGLVAAGMSFINVAAEDAQSAALLAGQLRRSTGATEDNIAAVEAQIAAMEMASGVADTDLRKSLGILVAQTQDAETAFEGLDLALDIAAATGKDQSTVVTALSRAYAGNFNQLRRLDPQLESMIKDGASLDEVFGSLTATFGGANEEMMDTAAGGMRRLQLQVDNTKEAIGFALMPILEAILPVLQDFAAFAQENADVIAHVMMVVGGLAAAIVGLNLVMKAVKTVMMAAKVATMLFNAVMAANPVVLVTLAVIALIAIFVALQRRFDIVGKAIRGLQTVFRNVSDRVRDMWQRVVGFFEDIPDKLRAMGRRVVNILTAPYRTAFNAIRRLWNSTLGKISFNIPSWVPGVGGRGFSFPKFPPVPALAEGGIVRQPTLALIGEAGPEAVVPLNRFNSGGGMHVTINMPAGSNGDDVVRALQNYQRSHGTLPLPITEAVRT